MVSSWFLYSIPSVVSSTYPSSCVSQNWPCWKQCCSWQIMLFLSWDNIMWLVMMCSISSQAKQMRDWVIVDCCILFPFFEDWGDVFHFPSWVAVFHCCRSFGRVEHELGVMPSGPQALLGSRFCSSFLAPSSMMLMSPQVGMSGSSNSSAVTIWGWKLSKTGCSKSGLVPWGQLSFPASSSRETPIPSVFFALTKLQNFFGGWWACDIWDQALHVSNRTSVGVSGWVIWALRIPVSGSHLQIFSTTCESHLSCVWVSLSHGQSSDDLV